MLRRQATRYGDRPLFVCDGTRWSYAEVVDIAARSGGRFAAAGIAKGDRVAILCGNRPEFIELFLGCAWIGAVSVPINVAARGPQLEHMLKTSGARLLVIETRVAAGAGIRRFFTARNRGDLDHRSGAASAGPSIRPFRFALCRDRGAPVAGRRSQAARSAHNPLHLRNDRSLEGRMLPACAVFLVGHQRRCANSNCATATCCTRRFRCFTSMPWRCFFQALLNGGTQVVEKRFSASNFWPAFGRSGATVTYVLGAMVPMLLSRPPCEDEKRHKVRVALAPGVPAHLHEMFTQRSGIYLLDAYGATESNAVIGTTMDTRRPGWMGKLFDGFHARVVDEDDNEVPDGTPGELLLRADEPFAMATGYFGMPEKTVEAWRNLWLHTGDRVVRNDEGYYKFIDRMKDSIRRRGENISSFEVERVIMSHPAVEIAAVFPVPSDLAEDEVMTTVVVK